MGYRSNIVIYVKEDKDVLNQIVKGALAANNEHNPDECEIGKNKNDESVLRIEYNGYKWYSSYPLVKYWENVFNGLDEEEYLFTREGENWDDVEIEGEYGEAYVNVEVEHDVDFESIKN